MVSLYTCQTKLPATAVSCLIFVARPVKRASPSFSRNTLAQEVTGSHRVPASRLVDPEHMSRTLSKQ